MSEIDRMMEAMEAVPLEDEYDPDNPTFLMEFSDDREGVRASIVFGAEARDSFMNHLSSLTGFRVRVFGEETVDGELSATWVYRMSETYGFEVPGFEVTPISDEDDSEGEPVWFDPYDVSVYVY